MRAMLSTLVFLALGLLTLGGCPAPSTGGDSTSQTGGIVPGTYIGTGTATTSGTTSDPVTTSGDMSADILSDGRVRIDGAEYSVGKVIRETDGTSYVRLDAVKDVSYASDTILINFDTSITFQAGLTFTGGGTITLKRIDDARMSYSEQMSAANTATGTTLNMQQVSSATLHR